MLQPSDRGRIAWHPPLEAGPGPAARRHVVILDGTLSSLDTGRSTNAGRIFKLMPELPRVMRPSVYYEAGPNWRDPMGARAVIAGHGIDAQIQRAYAHLAARYRPGDRIYLFGYSRGAFAVRSLAGLIDRIGLIRPRYNKPRMIAQVWRYYKAEPHGRAARRFARKFCHRDTRIEAVGVFDTVKALGWRLPGFAAASEAAHDFHSHHLGDSIRHGFHALALDETRVAFAPLLWECPESWKGHVEQVWFRGNHGDVGGQLAGFAPARPLANVPLVWMLEKAESCGLPLPEGWRDRFPCDATAPSSGPWRGWGKAFPRREPRVVGQDRSEAIHPTAVPAAPTAATKLPLAAPAGAEAAAPTPQG